MTPRRGRRSGTVIRAPNHLGELVLALPALEAAARRAEGPLTVQVRHELAPVLEMAGLDAGILPLRSRRAVLREARRLRSRAPRRGVLLTPSFSAALLFRLAGVPVRRGTATDARAWLLTDPVDREPLLRGHRVREYLSLVEAPPDPGPGGETSPPPSPRLRIGEEARASWAGVARKTGPPPGPRDGHPVAGLVPGGEAPARRWPLDRWIDLAGRLAGGGARVLVFGGRGDTERTARIAAEGGGRDLGGRTDLPALAGGLAACDVVVANDTGPMHLAAALDRPLLVVWGAGDLRQTRPLSERSRVLARPDLPCHPCLERDCPRRGPGFRAARARRECLTLIGADEVEAAVRATLDGPGRGSGLPPGGGNRAAARAAGANGRREEADG